MAKIIGNTTVTPMTVPDFAQTDTRKADYIKNKKISFLENDIGYAEKAYVDGKVGEIDEALEAFIDKTKVTMHFLDAQNTLHTAKINTWMTWAEAIETEEVKALGMGFTIGDDGYVRCYVMAFIKEADYEGDVSASTFPTWCIKGTDKVKDGQVYTSSGVYEMEIPKGGTWELIDTIVTTADVKNVTVRNEPDGTPYNFKKLLVLITNVTDGASGNAYVQVNATQTRWTVSYYLLTHKNAMAYLSIEGNLAWAETHSGVGDYSQFHNYSKPLPKNNFDAFQISANGTILTGTTFEIWGVRNDENV